MDRPVASKMGGRPVWRVWVKGGRDLFDAVLSTSEGGTKLDRGLVDLVAAVHGPAQRIEIAHEPGEPCHAWLDRLSTAVDRPDPVDAVDTATDLVAYRPDIVALSLSSDLSTSAEDFLETMPSVVRLLQDVVGAHVLILNCSSVDPRDREASTDERVSLRAHRLNRALIDLSTLEGISVIDADRVIAQLGARAHVSSFLDYSDTACAAIAQEFLRVLGDYGFFERRPLVAQVGRRREPA